MSIVIGSNVDMIIDSKCVQRGLFHIKLVLHLWRKLFSQSATFIQFTVGSKEITKGSKRGHMKLVFIVNNKCMCSNRYLLKLSTNLLYRVVHKPVTRFLILYNCFTPLIIMIRTKRKRTQLYEVLSSGRRIQTL